MKDHPLHSSDLSSEDMVVMENMTDNTIHSAGQ